MRRFFIFIILSLLIQNVNGQELPVYNEYHLNKALINPAIIGSEECIWFKGTDRHQWLGIEGAPQIQTFSVEAAVWNKKTLLETNKRIHGIGGFLYRDKNGAYSNIGGQFSYAYHFYINKLHGIKLGLGLSVRIFQASLSEADFRGDPDPLVTGGTTSVIRPDIGAGLFLYNQKFYTGLSVAGLMNSPIGLSENTTSSPRNYFLIAGYISGNARTHVRVLPSVVIKATEDLRKQLDLNTKLLFDERWWLAISYRHNFDNIPGRPLAIIPMVGIRKGNISFGYALELSTSTIQKFNYGTHEFMISYQLCKDGYRCPVYR